MNSAAQIVVIESYQHIIANENTYVCLGIVHIGSFPFLLMYSGLRGKALESNGLYKLNTADDLRTLKNEKSSVFSGTVIEAIISGEDKGRHKVQCEDILMYRIKEVVRNNLNLIK